MRYDLEVLRGDEIVAAESLVASGLGDVWSRITKIAENIDAAGCRIRVTEEAGGIAIMIAAVAARRLCGPPASA